MDSKIKMTEVVLNKDRRFGSNLQYYPCHIILVDGTEVNALFTYNQIKVAVNRAGRNPEDIPEDKSLWTMLFGGD